MCDLSKPFFSSFTSSQICNPWVKVSTYTQCAVYFLKIICELKQVELKTSAGEVEFRKLLKIKNIFIDEAKLV